jgi:hypothetical protein
MSRHIVAVFKHCPRALKLRVLVGQASALVVAQQYPRFHRPWMKAMRKNPQRSLKEVQFRCDLGLLHHGSDRRYPA